MFSWREEVFELTPSLKCCQVCKRILKICASIDWRKALLRLRHRRRKQSECLFGSSCDLSPGCSFLRWSVSPRPLPFFSASLLSPPYRHTVLHLSNPPTLHLSLTFLPLTSPPEWLCLMLYHDWWRGESALSVRRVPGGAGAAGGGAGGGEARYTNPLQEGRPGSRCWPRRRRRRRRRRRSRWGGRGGGGEEEERQWWWRRLGSWGSGAWGPRAGAGSGSWTETWSSHHGSYSRSRLCLRGRGAAAMAGPGPRGLLLLKANNEASQLVSSLRL